MTRAELTWACTIVASALVLFFYTGLAYPKPGACPSTPEPVMMLKVLP